MSPHWPENYMMQILNSSKPKTMVGVYLEVFVVVEDPSVEAVDPGVAGVGRVVDHGRAAGPAPVGDVVDGGGPHGHHQMSLCLLSTLFTLG